LYYLSTKNIGKLIKKCLDIEGRERKSWTPQKIPHKMLDIQAQS